MESSLIHGQTYARLIFPSILLLILIYDSPSLLAGEQKDSLPGIIGEDDRQIIETLVPPWNAIGRINVGGYRKRSICTGTLIAPDIVVTALHCVKNSQSERVAPLHDIHFLAGLRRDKFVAHSTAKCLQFPKHVQKEKSSNIEKLKSDIVFIVLNEKLNIAPVPLVEDLKHSTDLALTHASYTRDRPYLLAADFTCNLIDVERGLWTTDCDTNFGGSGGPVLVKNENGIGLAAIMVGVVKHKYSIAVPVARITDLLKTPDCSQN